MVWGAYNWAFAYNFAYAYAINDHKQVYQLTAYFLAKIGQALQVSVRVPLKPMQNHAMFSLFLHKSLLLISGDKVVRIHGDKTILAVGPASSQFTEPQRSTAAELRKGW